MKSKNSCGLVPDGETVSAVPAVVASPCDRRRNQENTVKMAAAAALGRKPSGHPPSPAPSSLIADRASFLYRLLDFGQSKKPPPPKTEALSIAPEPAAAEEPTDVPPLQWGGDGSGGEGPEGDALRSGVAAATAVDPEAEREKQEDPSPALNGTCELNNDKAEVNKEEIKDTNKQEKEEVKKVVRKESQRDSRKVTRNDSRKVSRKVSRKESWKDSRKELASAKASTGGGVSKSATTTYADSGDSSGSKSLRSSRDVDGRGDSAASDSSRLVSTARQTGDSRVSRNSSGHSAGTGNSASSDDGGKSPGKCSKGKDEGAKVTDDHRASLPPLEHKKSTSRDSPSRRVSFKVRGGSAAGRRSKMVESRVVLSSNTVAALTTKFNAIINENHASKTVLKIPQAKKQGEIKVILSRKNSSAVKKEVAAAVASSGGGRSVAAKKQQQQQQQQQPQQQSVVLAEDIKGAAVAAAAAVPKDTKRKINISYRPSLLGARSGNVKAAIQIFEQNASQPPPQPPQLRARGSGGKPETAARPGKGENPAKGEHAPLKRVGGTPGSRVKPEGTRPRVGKTAATLEKCAEPKKPAERDVLPEETETSDKTEQSKIRENDGEATSEEIEENVEEIKMEEEAKSRREYPENSDKSESPDATMNMSVDEKLTKRSSLFATYAPSKLQSGKPSNEVKIMDAVTNNKVLSAKPEDESKKIMSRTDRKLLSREVSKEVKKMDAVTNYKVLSAKPEGESKKIMSRSDRKLQSSEVSNDLKKIEAVPERKALSLIPAKDLNSAVERNDKALSGRSVNYLKKVNTSGTSVLSKRFTNGQKYRDAVTDCKQQSLKLASESNKTETIDEETTGEENNEVDPDVGSTAAESDVDAETDKAVAIRVDDAAATTAAVSSQSLTGGAERRAPGCRDVTDTREDAEADAFKTLVDNMKPNNSFLWRSKDMPATGPPPLPPKKPVLVSLARSRVPPVPPPKPAGLVAVSGSEDPRASSVEQEDIYDDIHPASSTGYAKLHGEEDAYDDVGVMTFGEATKAEPPTVPPPPPPVDDAEDGYEYCGEAPPYDDCEGGGYQLIATPPAIEEEGIYDDVKSLRTAADETTSISNCYESIYNGGGSAVGGVSRGIAARRGRLPQRCSGSSASSSSGSRRSGNLSSYDQTNSLYGVGGSRSDSASVSQASTVSGEEATHEVWSYQLTALGQPRSETSDEWMDMEPSDSEQDYATAGPTRAIVLVQERARSRKSPSWSRKVRNQWTKSHSENNSDSSDSEDHNYETLEDVTGQNNGDDHAYEDTDSFDSDDSDSNTYMKPIQQVEVGNRRLPDPPSGQNIYGISKIAEAAGKKMMEIGRSLKRIRSRHSVGSERTGLSSTNNGTSTTTKPPANQPYSAPLPPPPMEKVQSTGNLSNRKSWTLRKFKRSNSNTSSSPSTSTFYLSSPVDVDGPPVDNQTSADSRRHSAAPSLECETAAPSASANGTKGTNGTCTPPQGNGSAYAVGNSNTTTKRPASLAGGRRSSANVRPNSPPPLPPSQHLSDGSKSPSKLDKPINNSWYAAVGLWDNVPGSPGESSLSEHDTSQTTDVSDSSAGLDDGGRIQTCFPDEPLYQFYIGTIAEMAQRGASSEFDSDGYEEIGNRVPKLPARPSAMELIQPKEGQHRTLWCEIPEVVNSQVLSTLNPHQKKLQEAKFEIITSEASYMNSLNVLEHHFMSSPELNDDSILSKNDRRILFGNVIPVKRCSEKFLADLEKCWQDNILLHGICDTIYQHATKYFNVYVKYCSNQIHLDRTLRRLKEQQGKFAEVLTQLEASPKCQLLSLHSFLMLPMQRITRLPLLIDAVLTRLNAKDDEYQSCELALATLNKVVQDCNEGARHMERMEQILILSQQLDFPKDVKPVPIISSSRYLVRSGELVQLVWRGDDAKLTFGKKFSKVQLHVFLFSDLLVITKKKSDDCYAVVDHCPRNLVQITTAEGMSHLPVKFSADGGRNLMLLTMLQNHEKKTVEMILSCSMESDRQRWLEAVSQPTSDNPDERVYEEWDCPQVMAIHPYIGSQPDELSLDVSDVVNVLRKVSDGWYQGERMRDGERGWFPGNYTVEIASAHVRARNLKQRYRLLALSGNFLESQRKEKQSK